MGKLILLNKPFRVLCKFTDEQNRDTLANYCKVPDVYAAGRLDYDSEGLLLLTDQGWLQNLIAHPQYKLPKTYFAQVEGEVTPEALRQLRKGVTLKDGLTRPAKAEMVNEPKWLWERNPPIRERAAIPTSWIKLTITEGRNRQVRRMTAAVGFPTLRLIRRSIGPWDLKNIKLGEISELAAPKSRSEAEQLLKSWRVSSESSKKKGTPGRNKPHGKRFKKR